MLLIAGIALAAETADWHAEQARRFAKRGWTADAESEVAAGLALDPHHLDLNALCAELAQAAGDIDRALTCASMGATAPTGDLDTRARLSQLETWLRTNFGWVELRGPDGVPRAALALAPTSIQLDEALQVAIARAVAELRGGVRLPARVALPIGDYTVLGEAVRVEPGQTRVVQLPTARFSGAAGRGRRVDLAVGALIFSGADFANQEPGATLELTVSAPIGPLRLAAGAGWDARAYNGVGFASEPARESLAGLVRLSAPLEVGGAVFLVPGIAIRGAMLPGLELSCSREGSPLGCTPGRAGDDTLPIYANGFGVIPEAVLGGEFVTGRFVLGARGSVGHVFALLPDPGELLRDGDLVKWHSDRATLDAGIYTLSVTAGLGW